MYPGKYANCFTENYFKLPGTCSTLLPYIYRVQPFCAVANATNPA